MHLNRVMDGRKCYVYLPNDKKLELTVHAKQLGKDLYDIVVTELSLKERDYFGLTYKTHGEHYAWVQDDKKVLDHDMQLKSTDFPLEFLFSMKFYEDSVTVHKYPTTVEIIFLHARNLIYKGDIDVSSDLSFELAALCLQAVHGDYTCDEKASSDLKNLPCLPYQVIRQNNSPGYCEEQILTLYKKLEGTTKGQAILRYMSRVEKLANYGVHYYKVKDKARIPWWLGISNKGICQYNSDDKIKPHLVFQWRNLENLYFREKKFSVEVCSGHRRALSTGLQDQLKKTSGNNQAPKTYAWYGSPALIKSIWIMAIAQHQFYWDRKQSSKSKHHLHKNNTNTNNLCTALDNNSSSLLVPPVRPATNNMPRKTFEKVEVTIKKEEKKEQSPEMKAVQKKMVVDLKKRRLDLEDRLYDKVQELKEICRQEYDLTERLPIEYLRYLLPGEEKPVLRKKVKTEFTVNLRKDQKRVPTSSFPQDPVAAEELQQLEADCELLNQITKAAYKLAHDPSTRGRSRRKRLESYQKSLKKLQDLENKIDDLRKHQGKVPAERQSVFITATEIEIMNAMKECSLDDKSERSSLSDGMMLDDETSVSSGAEALSTHSTPALTYRPNSGSADVELDDIGQQRHHNGWNVSSLDSLESVGSRPSPEHGNSSDVAGSPISGHERNTSDVENANAMRIARALESPSRANKVNLREKRKHSEPSRRMGTVNPVVEIVEGTNPENGKDSRTSLTDSGHVTSSETRLQTAQEEDPAQRNLKSNTIRREVSDSSLSELSTQSNPAALPSSGHHPKFYPFFMSRPRARTQVEGAAHEGKVPTENPPQPGHIRKRSSSFTESGSNVPKVTLRRDNHRTLSRSKTHHEGEAISRIAGVPSSDASLQFQASLSANASSKTTMEDHKGLTASQSANELPPPMFDTNLNICRQYLSGSQGQLTQNNINMMHQAQASLGQFGGVDDQRALADAYQSAFGEQAWSDISSANPANLQRFGQNVSANNSNNKLNFGQIYKISQTGHNPEVMRIHSQPNHLSDQNVAKGGHQVTNKNVPKCNSLDSVLDSRVTDQSMNPDTLKNYALEQQNMANMPYTYAYSNQVRQGQNAARPNMDHHPSNLEAMTNLDRDKFNNQAFEEIRGMAWVPSFDEYGSRASVAESLPAKSKKEDIMQLLQQHIAHNWRPKRTPSTSSSSTMRNKADSRLRAKIRAEILRDREAQSNQQMDPYAPRDLDTNVKTWEGYKRDMQTLKRNQNQPGKPLQSGNPVNIFKHNPPPLPRQAQGQAGKQQQFYQQAGATQQNLQYYQQSTIQRQVHKGYVNQNGYVVPLPTNGDTGRRTQLSYNQPQPATSRYRYQQQHSTMQQRPNSAMQEQHKQSDGHFQTRQQDSLQGLKKQHRANTKDSEDKPRTRTKSGALVVQAVTTSPDGHKVSVFSVAKSAPNTPLPDRKHEESSKGFLSDDDSDDSFSRTITANSSINVTLSLSMNANSGGGELEGMKSPTRSQKTEISLGSSEPTKRCMAAPKVVVTRNADEEMPQAETGRKNSDSDASQAMEIEAAREAQKLMMSRDNVLRFESGVKAPTLPQVPPNASLRSSRRGRRQTSEIPIPSSTCTKERHGREKVSRLTLTGSPGRAAATPTPQAAEGRARSRSRNRRNTKPSDTARRAASPGNSLSSESYASPVESDRTAHRSASHDALSPTTPAFQRTLSTPSRSKPLSLSSAKRDQRNRPSKTKSTGMYKESISGPASKNLPPTGSKTSPVPPPTQRPDPRQQQDPRVPRTTYRISQSGTLPRTPKASKKVERAGSTTGSALVASAGGFSVNRASPMPNLRQNQSPQYYSPSRQNIRRNTLRTPHRDEDLKYKRSMSENWSQQQALAPAKMPQHPSPVLNHPHHMYHHMGHHGMVPTGGGDRTHEPPRRTASADDLLWTPDSREQNTYNMGNQQGTLV